MSGQKVVLITGGSSGIGERTAIEFAKLGYKVAITGRNQERLSKVAAELVSVSPNKSKEDFLALRADFSDSKQIDLVVPETVSKFGGIDILVNNAGFTTRKRNLSPDELYDDFKETLQVNLFAPFRLAQMAKSYLLERKGVIINVSSIADRLGMPSISYSVSKAGLSMLTKCLASSYDCNGIRVVAVCPGPIMTNFAENMKDLGPLSFMMRPGEPSEVADAIVFLASDKASYIHACTLDVDGGSLTKFGGIFTKLKEVFPPE